MRQLAKKWIDWVLLRHQLLKTYTVFTLNEKLKSSQNLNGDPLHLNWKRFINYNFVRQSPSHEKRKSVNCRNLRFAIFQRKQFIYEKDSVTRYKIIRRSSELNQTFCISTYAFQGLIIAFEDFSWSQAASCVHFKIATGESLKTVSKKGFHNK